MIRGVFRRTVRLGAIGLLGLWVGAAEAGHAVQPCYPGRYDSAWWLPWLVGFLVVALGFFVFGSTVSNKIKRMIRPRRRR